MLDLWFKCSRVQLVPSPLISNFRRLLATHTYHQKVMKNQYRTPIIRMSGEGFEPPITWTQTKHDTKLHYPLVVENFLLYRPRYSLHIIV